MDLNAVVQNFFNPPVMFFFLGLIAVLVKSDLEVPPAMAKFLTLYLLFDIGVKGGYELFESGFTTEIVSVLVACVVMALIVPIVAYRVLRIKLNVYDAGAIAATYGSVSAVTFATATNYLSTNNIGYGGFMVAGMAIMESPSIVIGLVLVTMGLAKEHNKTNLGAEKRHIDFKEVFRDALFNGSIVLLMGSLVIGYLVGKKGHHDLEPFTTGIFKGMLCLYLLDMGLVAGARMGALKQAGGFLVAFALITPIINATLGITIAHLLGLEIGNALLFTVLCASASYIAVPAAMRMAVPEANMSLLLPLSLGLTFPLNIILGIPSYMVVIEYFWK